MKDDPEVNKPEEEEKEIDLLELAYKLWSQRKLLLVWCMWGAIAGLIIAFSIPKEYTTEIKLAPESQGTRMSFSGGLSALASMAGLSTGSSSGSDAVYPQLYPDIVESVPFATSLFNVPLTDSEGNEYLLRDYLKKEIKKPWWGYITGLPMRAVGFVLSGGKKKDEVDTIIITDNFKLTPEEMGLVGMIRSRVKASVDQKTNLISIETEMQDPLISAVLADTVVKRLQDYVTDYRTNKARKDLDYAEMLNSEAQDAYYEAQQRLADYVDRNQNLATKSAQVTKDRLENEADLAFNVYNETAIQVQNAKSKVQETTPVYTEITPATVPIQPTSPKKGLIIGGFIFLAFVACAAWILFGTPLVSEYKSKVKEYQGNQETSQEGNEGSPERGEEFPADKEKE
ncbi:MAG: chain-length determining protein [Muribaculaceae bacterium]|nr:chain-length determining protein [Muribaculaceae bacterium]